MSKEAEILREHIKTHRTVLSMCGEPEDVVLNRLLDDFESNEDKIAELEEQLANVNSFENILIYEQHKRRLYNIWHKMVNRCYDKNDIAFENYGGRGIKVCEEWLTLDGFHRFCIWALTNGYNETLTIDRIDNNGNYKPSNCRWADRKAQNNNTRKNMFITYQGETLTITQMCEKYNKNVDTISWRIKRGWSVEKAFEKPIRKGNYSKPKTKSVVSAKKHSILKNCKVPKFKIGQEVFYLKHLVVVKGKIQDILTINNGFHYNFVWDDYEWIKDDKVFATKEEAEQRLKEIKNETIDKN